MRTTIDLDPELHASALEKSRSLRVPLSHVINDALRAALRPVPPVQIDERTGLGVVRVGRPITAADVANVLDDE